MTRTTDKSAVVRHSLRWIAGAKAPKSPPSLNRIGVRRYAPAEVARLARTILLLMPGFTGGVNDLDRAATYLVGAGEGSLEVWALERRNHLMEDLRGMEMAEAAEDPRVALGYYFDGRPCGFTPVRQEDVPWMRHWGLAVVLADMRAAVRRARRAVGTSGRVLLGGHSLGGMIAQCYAAWDFRGAPGHGDLDGLVLLDGAVGGPSWTVTTGLAQDHEGRAAIAAGELFWDRPGRGASPRVGIFAQVAAMAAIMPSWRYEPSLILPLVAGLVPVPDGPLLTNEAALGYLVDAETGPIASYRAHVGRLDPAPIARVGERSLLGWRPHARLPGETAPCREPAELEQIARALRQLDGTNGMEWYASRRLNADVDLSSNLDSRDEATRARAATEGLRLWHNAGMPLPVFGAVTRSDEQSLSRYTWYRDAIASDDFTLLELPEYDHLDPLFARGPNGGNRCLTALAAWIKGRRQTSGVRRQ
jgi:pimeloyl-ACP methyl ester carboxylesterase